jgi:drug/metabolite transporter (DMT)-like permease
MFTKASIESYFVGEKQESLFFLLVGIMAVGLAVYFFLIHKGSLQKGIAIPLLLIGIIQIIVGYTVWARSDRQRTDMVYAFDMNPALIEQQEMPRMEKVMQDFKIYRNVEIILLAVAIGLVIFFREKADHRFWLGVGLGLGLQAVLMLGADYFAEQRGKIYLKQMQQWIQRKTSST